MILDYVASTGVFILRPDSGPWDDATRRKIQKDHGLDWTHANQVLYTREPYAAVAFWQHATPGAQHQLLGLQAKIERSWALEGWGHIKCPADKELAPFQIAGVEYALDNDNTLIGDQPGLGKTMQAICFANEIGAKRVLCVVPATIRLQWAERIREWTTMRWPFTVYPILNAKMGVHPDAHWTIVSYDLARKEPIWMALAQVRPFDLLIIDEGHYLKTIDAQRTRTVFGGGENPIAAPLAARAGSILDLSGTPLPNRPREAFTAARGLCHASIDHMSETKFQHRFNPSAAVTTDEGQTFNIERQGRHGELQARLRGNFMVRRLKKDVQPQLKLPLLEVVHVQKNGEITRALEAERLLGLDPLQMKGLNTAILGEIATVRRMMGLAIAPQAADYCAMIMDGGEEKLFVATYHTQVLDHLENKLQRYNVLRIDGAVSAAQREIRLKKFQQPGRAIMLGQILAIGTGTDGMQKVCSRGVCVEPDWVPGVNEQLVNRLDRMGQDEKVLFSFLVAPDSFSERVLGTSLKKADEIDKALDRQV